MDTIKFLIDLFLHLDTYLAEIISQYGIWTYVLLFFIIFLETGFVITPFLPGDSLLFIAGTLSSTGSLNIFFLYFILLVAAIAGDNTNYWVGRIIGPRVFV